MHGRKTNDRARSPTKRTAVAFSASTIITCAHWGLVAGTGILWHSEASGWVIDRWGAGAIAAPGWLVATYGVIHAAGLLTTIGALALAGRLVALTTSHEDTRETNLLAVSFVWAGAMFVLFAWLGPAAVEAIGRG